MEAESDLAMPARTLIIQYFIVSGTLGALLCGAVIAAAWRILRRGFPRAVRTTVARAYLLAFSYAALVTGFMLDSWWHVSVGRESFFIPPHLLVIAAVAAVALTAAAALRNAADEERAPWMLLLLLAGAFLFGFAFDDTIHRLFGEENLLSALIFLAPPHLFIGLAGLALGFAAAALIARLHIPSWSETDRGLLLFFVLGATLAGAEYLFIPFWPYVSYQIFGSAGAFAAVFTAGLFLSLALRYVPETKAGATFLAIFAAFFMALREKNFVNPELGFPYYRAEPLPFWFLPVSLILAAAVVDLCWHGRFRPLFTGILYGLAHALIFYPLARWWVLYRALPLAEFDTGVAIPLLLAAAGGGAAFWFADAVAKRFRR